MSLNSNTWIWGPKMLLKAELLFNFKKETMSFTFVKQDGISG